MPIAEITKDKAEKVYQIFHLHAENNLPCPTNLQIAKKLRLMHSTGTITIAIKYLVSEGRIIIKKQGKAIRKIHIVETGKSTAWSQPHYIMPLAPPVMLLSPIKWPDYSAHNLRFKPDLRPAPKPETIVPRVTSGPWEDSID